MNSSKSVCIITSFYPPVFSGSAIHCAELAINLAQRGCRVTVITSQVTTESPTYEKVNNVNIYRLPSIILPKLNIALNFPWLNLSFSPANLRRVINILQENPPDILHLHNHMFDSAMFAVIAARKLDIPLVLSVHTIIKHTNPIYDLFLHLVDRLLLKYFVVQQADIVLCQDEIVENYVKKTFGYKNIALIPYGITPLKEPDLQKTTDLRKKYGISDSLVILSIGHLHETRNRRELIEIMPQLLKVFPALKLLIVGYVGTDSARRQAAALGVEDSVLFTGAIPHEDIPDFLALADIEAHWFDQKHPHRTPGIAGQEVMIAGRVLATNARENVYGAGVLKDGENVVILNPSDSNSLFEDISEILGDENTRRRIGKRAKRTAVKHFSWDMVCKQILEAYESVCRFDP